MDVDPRQVESTMQNIKVYDSGEKFTDRFIIVLLDEPTHNNNYMMLGVDACGGKYFSNFTEGKDGPHLGKLIGFADLPAKTREHVISRIYPVSTRKPRHLCRG